MTRRALLIGTSVAAGAIGASAVREVTAEPTNSHVNLGASPQGSPVRADGTQQAGVTRPHIPQQHCIVAVGELDLNALEATLQNLGERILGLTAVPQPESANFPDGPGSLTVTVGLGARALAATSHPELAQSVLLPEFKGDAALPESQRSGDIFLSVNAADPGALEPALAAIVGGITGYHELWSDFGFRATSEDEVSRNPLGYHDGIIVPRTEAELADNVWINHGPLSGGTICVIRRFALDTARFRELPPTERDAVIGREQLSGVPLSGGSRDDAVNLIAKNDAGDFLIPIRAHTRAAHPSFTGSDLMLRRSYGYRASASDHGLLFIAFQKTATTFSRTQLRLDESDDLMGFATPTASVAFAILPGFAARSHLGSSLFR